ncbi:putative haloacid dehalogenase [Bodo saltans virus]|uniref:Haloacid dehalogenase n=1 Tax=Bodo saltans virus TaxID=2024608 RepID=A0A2H4UUK2_9VIRU|nr:putative haloacid dehalogenase [Bodo saltans virus]ATZ80613.1 putative haloacid dehalogenase [Bodo saltans virus]
MVDLNSIKLIILDMDNTIYNYDKCNDVAVEKVLKYCESISDKDYNQLYSKYYDIKRLVNSLFSGTAISHDKLLQFKIFVENNEWNNKSKIELTMQLYDIYMNEFFENIEPYSMLYIFLKKCIEKNIKVVILTNNLLEIQLRIFNLLQLEKYIENIYTSYEIGYEKPNNNCFNYIIDKYKFEKSEICMIGDSRKHDYEGAINFGIHAILFDKLSYDNLIKKL